MPASQHAPAVQLGTPVHEVMHDVPVQLTLPAHARAPEQSTLLSVPFAASVDPHESGFSHRISHDAAVQAIEPAHVVAAVQLILHLLPPQPMRCLQAPAPMHATVHALECAQSMARGQESAPVQITEQGMPAGQAIGSSHEPAGVHVTMHVPSDPHVPIPASAQSAGHAATASMGRASIAASIIAASDASAAIVASPVSSIASAMSLASGSVPKLTSGNEHALATAKPLLARMNARSAFDRGMGLMPARTARAPSRAGQDARGRTAKLG